MYLESSQSGDEVYLQSLDRQHPGLFGLTSSSWVLEALHCVIFPSNFLETFQSLQKT